MSTRSDATKKRLFDAAMELIGERGFTDASVDEIVHRAGVAKGTVYYHFAGKAELVEALIADRLRPAIDRFRAVAAAHANDPRAAIEAIVRTELEVLTEEKSFSKLLLTEMRREDRVLREMLPLLCREMVTPKGVREPSLVSFLESPNQLGIANDIYGSLVSGEEADYKAMVEDGGMDHGGPKVPQPKHPRSECVCAQNIVQQGLHSRAGGR